MHTYKFKTNDKTLTTFSPISDQHLHLHTSPALPTPPAQSAIFKVKARATRHFKGPWWRPQAGVLGLGFAEARAETWKIGPWAGGQCRLAKRPKAKK